MRSCASRILQLDTSGLLQDCSTQAPASLALFRTTGPLHFVVCIAVYTAAYQTSACIPVLSYIQSTLDGLHGIHCPNSPQQYTASTAQTALGNAMMTELILRLSRNQRYDVVSCSSVFFFTLKPTCSPARRSQRVNGCRPQFLCLPCSFRAPDNRRAQ